MTNADDDSIRRSEVCRLRDELKARALKDSIRANEVLADALKNLEDGQEDYLNQEVEHFFTEENIAGSKIVRDDNYSTLIKNAFEHIAISVDGIIVEAHEDFARDNGYELLELIGSHVTYFLIPGEHESAFEALKRKEELVSEFSALKKDGSTFTVEAHGCIIGEGWKAREGDSYPGHH